MDVVENYRSNCNKYIQIGKETEKLDANEKYCDVASIRVPETLTDLILELNKIFALDSVNVEYVQTLMTMYKSNPKEWRKFAKFDQHRYTRNLVDEGNGKFNLMLLCWNENQGSSIHSHANSHCFLKVLEGSVKEELYDWPSQHQDLASEPEQHGLECRKISTFNTNEVAYISDNIGLHRVENPSHTDKAVTLHLYSPPFQECYCFDKMTGHSTVSKMTFWSKFGKRTPFGKDCGIGVAENN
ncbi:hypothetical protein CHS0354_008478 [Potamilus streckersoni]|uniref:Cysteine dioxygenase n=1 Tax=Potamilus streckersoni TaxID=2493646 RepID=A0AAE0VHY4_9BIVA|nr:hypothetical protein CHS0354_008478 [Potamilus streckersoni]